MKRYIKPWEDWHSIYEGAKGLKSRKIVLLDGTSSAGKSHALKHLGVRPYWKAKGTGGWVVVASDDFSGTGKGEGREGEERRLKLDHPNIRPWAKENEDAGIVSGLYRKDGKAVPENPYEDEYIKGTDPRLWYVAQEIKKGPWKKIVIDDIGNGVLRYLPGVRVEWILLHAPLPILLKNLEERNKRAKQDKNFKNDDREVKMVLDQYTEKYRASRTRPDRSMGDPDTVLTRSELSRLFKEHGLSGRETRDVLDRLGIKGDQDHWIQVKSSYLKPGIQLVNVDPSRTDYLEEIDGILRTMIS